MNNFIGEKIIELSKKNNITQRQLAAKLGITETALSRYINGTRRPKVEILSDIAILFEISVDELIGSTVENRNNNDYPEIRRLIARNSKIMTLEEKKELINILFTEE